MDFAPYQDQSPETTRTLSPSPQDGRRSRSFSPSQRSAPVHQPTSKAFETTIPQPPNRYSDEESGLASNGGRGITGGFEDTRAYINQFETSLPLRLDYEAMLAYLVLPPAGGVFLLLFEHKSDYVRGGLRILWNRFHAWQSSLIFTTVFVLHVIFAWIPIISWILFVGDLILIGWLTIHAYQDASTLDRHEVPFFGPLASSFVDQE